MRGPCEIAPMANVHKWVCVTLKTCPQDACRPVMLCTDLSKGVQLTAPGAQGPNISPI
jgi:hypothetical protein